MLGLDYTNKYLYIRALNKDLAERVTDLAERITDLEERVTALEE